MIIKIKQINTKEKLPAKLFIKLNKFDNKLIKLIFSTKFSEINESNIIYFDLSSKKKFKFF